MIIIRILITFFIPISVFCIYCIIIVAKQADERLEKIMQESNESDKANQIETRGEEERLPRIEISEFDQIYSYYVYYEFHTFNEHGTGAISLSMSEQINNANDIFDLASFIKNNVKFNTAYKIEKILISNLIEFQQTSENVAKEIGCG